MFNDTDLNSSTNARATATAPFIENNHPQRNFLSNGKSLPLLQVIWKGLSSWHMRDFEFRPVQTMEELKVASHLVYEEYLKRKLQAPQQTQSRFVLQQLLPNNHTFIVVYKRRYVLATLTLIQDSPLGVPMDKNYKAQLDVLRKQKGQIAEASLLAFDRSLSSKTFSRSKRMLILINFFKVIFDYVRTKTDIAEIVACYHPRHDTLYNFLQFQPLGGLTDYAIAGNNPAIARHFNFRETEAQAQTHVAYKLFYGTPASPEKFKRMLRLSPDNIKEMIHASPLIHSDLTVEQVVTLKNIYPEYDFSEILPSSLPLAANG